MANFDEFKQRATEAAEVIADKSIEFARFAVEKTKAAAKITKLSAELISEKESIKRKYAEIGKAYYEAFKNEPKEFCLQQMTEITIALEKIKFKKQEIDELKATFGGSGSDDDFSDAGWAENDTEDKKEESDSDPC